MAKKKAKPDPLTQGKGQRDEVDQSKGIFPSGVPHPEGAEERTPGELGGGPYEESGRGGVELTGGPAPSGARRVVQTEEVREEEEEKERAEEAEPKGALPAHEQAPQKKVA